MAKSVYRRGGAQVSFNMTPMIDCTFQLIIFFLLTTQAASAELVPMKLPDPIRSQARELKENKAIINVVPYSKRKIEQDRSKLGIAKEYRVKGEAVKKHDLEKIVNILKEMKRTSDKPDKFAVEVRADQKIHYDQIQPVLRVLQDAQMANMRITALIGGREE